MLHRVSISKTALNIDVLAFSLSRCFTSSDSSPSVSDAAHAQARGKQTANMGHISTCTIEVNDD